MKGRFDEQADAISFRLDDSPIQESDQARAGVILDFEAALVDV
jgi:hypothetical protein